jgi:hypothetical protein
MEYWLNKLNENENDTEALFWLANNNDKNQKYYIEKGLSIDSDNVLLKATSLRRYTDIYLDDILNNLNDIDEKYLGYIYLELGKYYRCNNKKGKEYLEKAIIYNNLIAYMYLNMYFSVNIEEIKENVLMYIKQNELDTNMYFYLRYYYQYIEKNYELMKKYYIFAILNGYNEYHDIPEEIISEAIINYNYIYEGYNKRLKNINNKVLQFNNLDVTEINKCTICRNENRELKYDCLSNKHLLCKTCYMKFDECPYCGGCYY